MKKQTILDQTEILRDGTLQLRFAKQIIDDDGTVISTGWHRTTLPPGHDIDAQIVMVNEYLVSNHKCAAIHPSEINEHIKPHAKIAWTPERVAAHKAKVAAHIAEMKSLAAKSEDVSGEAQKR